MTCVGVVGAGTIGIGVAHALAEAGHKVVLVDVAPEALERAPSEIKSVLRLQAMLNKGGGRTLPSQADLLARIERTVDYGALAAAEFVVENVTERWETKRETYRRLDEICRPEAVFAANTSCISITKIAAETRRPDRVLGMHFMNPVPLKPTVEVIKGHHTSEATLAAAEALLASMGKRGIVVMDWPGFVSNRVLMLTVNEAILTVHDGVASAEQVDEIFKTCFGHKMGPLETADLIGLDTILQSLEVLQESFGEDKYRPAPLLKKMVSAGLLGRKSGRGFYDYRAEL